MTKRKLTLSAEGKKALLETKKAVDEFTVALELLQKAWSPIEKVNHQLERELTDVAARRSGPARIVAGHSNLTLDERVALALREGGSEKLMALRDRRAQLIPAHRPASERYAVALNAVSAAGKRLASEGLVAIDALREAIFTPAVDGAAELDEDRARIVRALSETRRIVAIDRARAKFSTFAMRIESGGEASVVISYIESEY